MLSQLLNMQLSDIQDNLTPFVGQVNYSVSYVEDKNNWTIPVLLTYDRMIKLYDHSISGIRIEFIIR